MVLDAQALKDCGAPEEHRAYDVQRILRQHELLIE